MSTGRSTAGGKAWIAALLAGAGCHSPMAESPIILCGTVARAQPGRDYVILETEQPCPPGQILDLSRGSNAVGRVRAGEWRQGMYQAADLVSGAPAEGDWFREPIRIPRERP